MSVKHWGHTSPTLTTFLARPLIALAAIVGSAHDVFGADAEECRCLPCPGRGNDGHGLTHCAECCFGTGVMAEIDCPDHGDPRYQRDAGNTVLLLTAIVSALCVAAISLLVVAWMVGGGPR